MQKKFVEKVRVVENEKLASRVCKLVLEAPKTSAAIRPGQFVHLQVSEFSSAMLRRPFSVFDRDEKSDTITILYEVRGRGTELMTSWKISDTSSVISPLGNTWAEGKSANRVLLVGAGLGAAPLFMLTKNLVGAGSSVDVVLGATTKELLVTKESYSSLSLNNLVVSTDDGSEGFSGFCTIPARELIESNNYDYVATCGPYPVMREVASACSETKTACEVSMEGLMACGVGACKTCVVETVHGKKRSCADGPIFDAKDILW